MPGLDVLDAASEPGLPPKPDLTLGYLPARSQSVSFEGTLLDYLPVQVRCKGVKCSATFSVNGPPVLGLIDPGGKQHDSLDYTAYYDQLVATEMIDPASGVAQGSTLIEEDYWQLLWAVGVPANTPFATDQAVQSGITDTDTTTFSYTIGVGSADKALLTASLSETFQHAVAISEQETTTYKFQWPSQPTDTFVGVYQLMQSFSVQAGGNFTVWLSQQNAVYGQCSGLFGFCLKFESGAAFAYPTPTFLQAAAGPPHIPAGRGMKVPTLGIDEIKKLVQHSISVSAVPPNKVPNPDPVNRP
jgi:hypothetical protein